MLHQSLPDADPSRPFFSWQTPESYLRPCDWQFPIGCQFGSKRIEQ